MENLAVFSDGTIATPHLQWKDYVDGWLTEFKQAANERLALAERRLAEDEIRSMMAVSASARAMEHSGGSGSEYVSLMTRNGGEIGDYGTSSWSEFMLHNDPAKLNMVVNDTSVSHYYQTLLRDAGITSVSEWSESTQSTFVVDAKSALSGRLVQYLSQRGGLDAYAEHLVQESRQDGLSYTANWATAKLACDAFLVDKYTRWLYCLEKSVHDETSRVIETGDQNAREAAEVEKKRIRELKPTTKWSGDPLRSILQPSWLQRVNKAYTGRGERILDVMDVAFRPTNLMASGTADADWGDPLCASMVVDLATLARYSESICLFTGDPRAKGIPLWSEDVMYKTMPQVVELLDDIYGGIHVAESAAIGKEIMGEVVVRLLLCKAIAVASNTDVTPMAAIFRSAPNADAFEWLWGRNRSGTTGFIQDLAGPRTRIKFTNRYSTEKRIRQLWDILNVNSENPRIQGPLSRIRDTLGFVFAVAEEIVSVKTGRPTSSEDRTHNR